MSNPNVQGIGFTSQRTRDRLVQRLREAGICDERVLMAMAAVPRHLFVDEALAHRAYEDIALPIGCQQTISQPYIVARMTEILLAGETLPSVLEIGTGCGYQTALLSEFAGQVYTIERIASLLRRTRQRLHTLRYRNISFREGDGHFGWPKHGPYAGILVAAAPREVPQTLLDQLAVGGRLVIPLGGGDVQELCLFRRTGTGITQESLESVRFVPLRAGRVR